MLLHIDFETRSTVDLRTAGIDNYARHPDTDIWCCGFAWNDDEPQTLMPPMGRCPWPLADVVVYAHNATFELAIWNHIMVPRYGWPPLPLEQVRCTMAMAYAMGLPGSLEKAAAAMGIPEQKDAPGGRLMMQMARPRAVEDGQVVWWNTPEKIAALLDYCKQDVRIERALASRLIPLSESEQRLWVLDQRINTRGVPIDRPTIHAAVAVVQTEADRLHHEMRRITDNVVGFTSEVARLTTWLRSQGVVLEGVAKGDILDALKVDRLPDAAREALLIRQEAGKTSTAKLQTMLEACSADGRVRHTMQYHGAATGRWAGRRIQPHNFPRPVLAQPDIDAVLDALPATPTADLIRRLELLYGAPFAVLSDCLRGMICAAPGAEFVAGDYANIEGRGIAWLAGEHWKLDAFQAQDAKTGPEIYKLAAAKIYRKAVEAITKTERQVGKVAELALGYQGGVDAFTKMAQTYGVRVSDDKAGAIKETWRAAHPRIVRYWWDVEAAAINAVTHPGTKFTAGPAGRAVAYLVRGSFLFCRLPSGRVLTYPYPKLKPTETKWGDVKDQIHYMTADTAGNWIGTATYGGKLVENITQAVCRDLLAYSITRCEAAGYPVVLHVHDEIVTEIPATCDPPVTEAILGVMAQTPSWAAGLPVKVEGWRGRRFRK